MSEEDSVDMDTFDAEKEMMEALAEEAQTKSDVPADTFDAEKEMMEALAEEAQSKVEIPAQIAAPPAISETIGSLDSNLDRILDIPLMLSAQLGSTRMLIKDLLQLGPGSIVELDKLAGEALEVLVNDRLVARGEVVMVNEKFGIRLTDVISPSERVKKLH
jgi:flagellar motor switch protein FliN/FliY